MSDRYSLLILPGDGIGPEVTAAAVEVLREVAPDVTVEERPIGGVAYDAHGDPFPQVTRDALKDATPMLLTVEGLLAPFLSQPLPAVFVV